MKTKTFFLNLICVISIIFITSSCEWLSFQNTADDPGSYGLYELQHVTDASGNIISATDADSSFHFFYRHWYGWTKDVQHLPIDSLFFMNKNITVFQKHAVLSEIKKYPFSNRTDFSLNNSKYVAIEIVGDDSNGYRTISVSEVVGEVKLLSNARRYIYLYSTKTYP